MDLPEFDLRAAFEKAQSSKPRAARVNRPKKTDHLGLGNGKLADKVPQALEALLAWKKKQGPRPVPKAYGYGRVSHRLSVDGDSVPAQMARCEQHYNYKLKELGIEWAGCIVEEKHESARHKSFVNRPAGNKLLGLLQRGDHLVVDKVDRLWRSLQDFVVLISYFKKMDIHVHFVSFSGCSLEIGTPMGDFFLSVMVAVAQLESDRVSERNKLAYERKVASGGVNGSIRIIGAVMGKVDGKKAWVWDRQYREWMRRCVEDEDRNGHVTEETRIAMEIERLCRLGFTPGAAQRKIEETGTGRIYFTVLRCERMAFREREYVHYGIHDPNDAHRFPLASTTKMHDLKNLDFMGPYLKAKVIKAAQERGEMRESE